MKFLPVLSFVGAAVAAVIDRSLAANLTPKPGEIKILNVSAIGSGCPAGHAYVNVDATGTVFDVAFDEFVTS